MKRPPASLLAVVFTLAPVAACFISNSPSNDAGATCSAETTIFAKKCATAGCHNAADQANGLDLESPGIAGRVSGAAAQGCANQTLVVPGDPSASYLLSKMAGTSTCGSTMPVGGSLSPSEIECVRSWIASLSSSADGGTPPDGASPDSGPACTAPQVSCGGKCVNTQTDKNNCGKCGMICPVACAAGACVTSCPMPTTNCNGSCVNTQTDPNNCSKCGMVCTGGKTCAAGVCSCGASVSFGSQVQPIFTSTCATAACHAGVIPKGALDLSAAKSYANLVNKPSSACSNRTRVIPGDATNSYLMSKLLGTNMCAGSQMPKIGQSLPPAQLSAIQGWICNGAPNN